jgi:hypothetical protein
MSITITITGDAAQVRAHMAALLGAVPLANGELGAPKQGTMLLVEPTETPVDLRHVSLPEEPASPPAEETRKRGRPRKDAGAAEAPAPSPEPASSTAPPVEEPSSPAEVVMTAAEAEAHRAPNAVPDGPKMTVREAKSIGEANPALIEASLEDVRDALRALAGVRGADPCSALLKKFGARKSSELKPEYRGAFVAEAKALVDA